MNMKAVSGIMLTLLLTGMLPLAFNIQPAEASGTIYIRADGSVEPPTASISSADNITYTFTENNYDEIVVQRSNIIIDGNGYTLQGSGSGDGFYLFGMNNVTIQNTYITNFTSGIYLNSSSFNTISGNTIKSTTIVSIELDNFSHNNAVIGNNITNNSYGVLLVDSSNDNTVSGNNITNNTGDGVGISHASDNTIAGNNITNNRWGVGLPSASNSTISGNNVVNNTYGGIALVGAYNNTIFGNNITRNYRNWGGILIAPTIGFPAVDNRFYHNNLIDNNPQVSNPLTYTTCLWDNGYPSGGNYWSNYTGVDLYSGPYQNNTGSDGIGDTSHIIDANNTDHFPLMKPYGGVCDIGITNITTSKTVVGQGYNLSITAKTLNYGVITQTFNMTVYVNQTVVGQTQISLTGRNSTTLTFVWNTTGFDKGDYTISAVAEPVPGETDFADNTFTDGVVKVTIPGDINGDCIVDMTDLGWIAYSYGATPSDPKWNPNRDITDDNLIDMTDLGIACMHYGETCP